MALVVNAPIFFFFLHCTIKISLQSLFLGERWPPAKQKAWPSKQFLLETGKVPKVILLPVIDHTRKKNHSPASFKPCTVYCIKWYDE